jgi:hypothetical protein
LIAYINVVKRVFIVLLASAKTNEMRHCEFNKSWYDPPRVQKNTLDHHAWLAKMEGIEDILLRRYRQDKVFNM